MIKTHFNNGNQEFERERLELLPEAHELENIFGSISRKLEVPAL
jgi:hypothetical protein